MKRISIDCTSEELDEFKKNNFKKLKEVIGEDDVLIDFKITKKCPDCGNDMVFVDTYGGVSLFPIWSGYVCEHCMDLKMKVALIKHKLYGY
jgi:ssDNA-binding Zn-finger/Zn-ribbon topoisomerase 1